MSSNASAKQPCPDIGRLSDPARQRASGIRLLVTDVDGVLTDGGLYFGPGGEIFKRFHTRDGAGVVLAREFGIEVGIITGRTSEIVTGRASELGIAKVLQGAKNKDEALGKMIAQGNIDPIETGFVGDDLQDLPAFAVAGFCACPADAHPAVARRADYICSHNGGTGVLREVIDLLLAAKGLTGAVEKRYSRMAPTAREAGRT